MGCGCKKRKADAAAAAAARAVIVEEEAKVPEVLNAPSSKNVNQIIDKLNDILKPEN